MVDHVVGSRQVHEDSTGDQARIIATMFSVRFSSWLVHDLPGRNPARSGMSFAATCSAIRFSMSRSNSL